MKQFEFNYDNMPALDDDSPENIVKADALIDAIGKYLDENGEPSE